MLISGHSSSTRAGRRGRGGRGGLVGREVLSRGGGDPGLWVGNGTGNGERGPLGEPRGGRGGGGGGGGAGAEQAQESECSGVSEIGIQAETQRDREYGIRRKG